VEGWIDVILEHYKRLAVCAFFGIASAGVIHIFDLNLLLRIILSIFLFFAWIILGLILEFLHSRRKKKD
jgi:hypothetical protein